MKSLSLNSSLSRYARLLDIGGFLRWWKAGLSICLPEKIRGILEASPTKLLIDSLDHELVLSREKGDEAQELEHLYDLQASPEGLRGRIQAFLGRTDLKDCRIVLRLPARKVLTKTIPLPIAAEGNLRQVVGFEIDRLTPFSPDQVYYDVQIVERQPANRRIQARYVVVSRSQLDALLNRLADAGLAPDAVEVMGETTGFNLLPPERRPQKSRGAQRLRWALAGLALILTLTAVLLPLWQQRSVVVDLLPKVAAAQKKAEEVLVLRKELEESIQSSQFLLHKRQERPPMIEVLNELTIILPDGTWVERLDISGAELQLRGQSPEASTLIGLIEASGLFQGVTFRSPVIADHRTGRDRFHLSAQISREAPVR